jgi:methylated-DNA-[protein]-cysteine S-methyltransferase
MSAKKDNATLTFGIWPTAWGAMGAVASETGLRRVILPHYAPNDLRDVLTWEHPGITRDDGAFAPLAELCRQYFNRQPVDFTAVACDLSPLAPFGRRILEQCRHIPYGQFVTYTALAKLAGEDGKQRAAAQALGANPNPRVIPCHRVTAAGGGLGGFSAPGGVELKRRMLDLEKPAVQ